jgi:hypothetical protein
VERAIGSSTVNYIAMAMNQLSYTLVDHVSGTNMVSITAKTTNRLSYLRMDYDSGTSTILNIIRNAGGLNKK